MTIIGDTFDPEHPPVVIEDPDAPKVPAPPPELVAELDAIWDSLDEAKNTAATDD